MKIQLRDGTILSADVISFVRGSGGAVYIFATDGPKNGPKHQELTDDVQNIYDDQYYDNLQNNYGNK